MDGDIVFYTHGDLIELNGTLLRAGELTVNTLNLMVGTPPATTDF